LAVNELHKALAAPTSSATHAHATTLRWSA
jgi:hypothetical protein